jgi:hypothetical protein
VLKIIAKVLAFDDEQLIAVGLKVPPIDLIGTLLTTVIGRPAPPPEVEVRQARVRCFCALPAATRYLPCICEECI